MQVRAKGMCKHYVGEQMTCMHIPTNAHLKYSLGTVCTDGPTTLTGSVLLTN